jgi:hypothetical protein
MRNFWILLAAAMLPACTGTSPQFIAHATMMLKIAPSSADRTHPATISAEVFNDGMTSYQRWEGCSFWGEGMRIKIVDPQQREVFLWDPSARPKCLDHQVSFTPGRKLTSIAYFNGTLYTSSGERIQAVDGVYVVTASAPLVSEAFIQEGSILERSGVIVWSSI